MYLTLFLLIGYLAVVMIGIKILSPSDSRTSFFSKEQTTILKGLCCIIVIFVHIPAAYSNKFQDLVGSFAYITVTLYFLLSGYGLRYSFENKQNYANNFMRNRVIPLIIPFLVIVIVKRLLGFDPYVGGLRFVYVLLLFYALMFICYRLKFNGGGYMICIGVLIYSIGGYLTGIGFGWNVEALGFLYGFLLGGEKCMTRVQHIFENYYAKVLMLAFGSSVIFGLMYLKYKTIYFWGEYLLRIVLGIVLIILVFTTMYRIKLGNRINILLGNISYEVYLIHGFVICILSLTGELLSSGLFIVLTVLISIMIAVPLHIIDQYITNRIRR